MTILCVVDVVFLSLFIFLFLLWTNSECIIVLPPNGNTYYDVIFLRPNNSNEHFVSYEKRHFYLQVGSGNFIVLAKFHSENTKTCNSVGLARFRHSLVNKYSVLVTAVHSCWFYKTLHWKKRCGRVFKLKICLLMLYLVTKTNILLG